MMSGMTGRLAEEARRLRTNGLSVYEIQQRLGVTKRQLLSWLGRPRLTADAKDRLYARAVALRQVGWSVNDIALEIGIAKSTAFQWVRHLPLDRDSERARKKRAHAKVMSEAQWGERRERIAAQQAAVQAEWAQWVGDMSRREILLAGAVAYWCEGAKSKPWRRQYELIFTNSDVALVRLFLAFAEAMGEPRTSLAYRVSIHETADAARATEWWAHEVGVPVGSFQRPTRKRHNPLTNRKNLTDSYHGCLVVTVPRARETLWRIEGIMEGIARYMRDTEPG